MSKRLKDGDKAIDYNGKEYTIYYRAPWVLIILMLTVAIFFITAGFSDRIFWHLSSQNGLRIDGVVTDMHSYRNEDNSYLKYMPTVTFIDPHGQRQNMQVKNASWRFNFKPGERVTVLWRANGKKISIYTKFKRPLGQAIILSIFVIIGFIFLCSSTYMMLHRMFYVVRH